MLFSPKIVRKIYSVLFSNSEKKKKIYMLHNMKLLQQLPAAETVNTLLSVLLLTQGKICQNEGSCHPDQLWGIIHLAQLREHMWNS